MNIYIIDDNEAKIELLPQFLGWMAQQFPAYSFQAGFITPKADAESAYFLQKALSDPDGLILLDLFMQGTAYEAAADTLLHSHQQCSAQRNYIWGQLRNAAHQPGITKLGATVVALAEHYGARLCWISTDERVADIVARYAKLSYPKLSWENEASWNSEVEEIRQLVENFRQPYLNATQAWKQMYEAVELEKFQFPKNARKPTNRLFPRDASPGHDACEHLSCRTTYAANESAVNEIVKALMVKLSISPTHEIATDHCYYWLKFVSREWEMALIPLNTMFPSITFDAGITINDGIGLHETSPGAFILALKMIHSSLPEPRISFRANGQRIEMCIHFYNSDPNDTVKKLRMKPGERMKGPPPRNHPGTVVLPLDYIKPDSIEPVTDGVIVTKIFNKTFAR